MRLSCPQGHQWESTRADNEPSPTCPICGSQVGSTLNDEFGLAITRDFKELRADDPSAAAILNRASQMPVLVGYDILDLLGCGGMGVVYKALHVSLKRHVALKMTLDGMLSDPTQLDRFRFEAEAIARLQHPNIVQIYEVGEHEGKPYLSLEFVDGGSLQQKLAGTPLPANEAARLIEILARATHVAHQHAVIHLDLKPGNVLLTSDGIPKITDFGLAKQPSEGSDRNSSGPVVGTPSYMSPEQAEGASKAIGTATDIYALGAILYETLTGRPPFRAATDLETLEQVRTQNPVSPSQLQSNTPRDLETICLKCLQKDPGKRYGSAALLADDLLRFLTDTPILAHPASVWERAWRWCRRNPLDAGLSAAVVIALIAGTVISSFFALRASARAKELTEETNRANQLTLIATDKTNLANANAELERQQRKRADEKEQESHRLLYAAHMDLAQSAWEEGRVGRVLQFLERHGPGTPSDSLRGFE